MHAANASPQAAARSRLTYLWGFLTLASCGFAMLVAGLWIASVRWMGTGTATLAFATLAFLFVQFWMHGTRPRLPPIAAPRISAPQPVPSLFSGALEGTATAPKSPPAGKEDLVEFQLVPSVAPVPTRLEVPPAFQIESQVDASPDAEAAWRGKSESPPANEAAFVPAVERRERIVEGLPILSSIFSAEPTPPSFTPEPTRPGKTRGQCGGCGTLLWAPLVRPIRLRCPRCGKVATLTS